MRFYPRHKIRRCRFKLTADFIAAYRVAELFAYRKPCLRHRVAAFTKQHHKIFVRNAFGMFVHVIVLIIFFESVFRLQGRLPVMRKENDGPCFFFLQEFCVRRSSSFWHGNRALCFFVFSWVGKFFSF